MSAREYDVIIAGGGLVGGALACGLAHVGARVAVIEAIPPSHAEQPSFDERTTALAPSTRNIFTAWGLWSDLAGAITPIRHIHCSEQGVLGCTHLDAEAEGTDALGWLAPNRALGATLNRRLAATAGADVYTPAELTSLERRAQNITVTASGAQGEHLLRGSLLVAADGARSRTRDMAGFSVAMQDYRQSAVITNVTPSRHHDGWAYERFTRSGPMAVLPISEGHSTVVWSLSHTAAAERASEPDEVFLAQMQKAFGYRLGRLKECTQRHVYPLHGVRAPRLAGERVALAGNAAHALHPVAGQGLNLSLRDAAELVEIVHSALSAGEDPGAEPALARYSQRRRADIERTRAFTNSLLRGFAIPGRFPRAVRGGALFTLSRCGPARRAFIRLAAGEMAPVPKAACQK